jgi:uncharacterized protein YkwD
MGYRDSAAAAAVVCMLLAFCGEASASDACPADQTAATAANAPTAVAALTCDINEARAQAGLRPLSWNWRLWDAAQRMAVDMTERHYFAHVTPEGLQLADRVGPTGYTTQDAAWELAENIGWGSGGLSSPTSIASGWLDSPEHRRNMLDPDFEDIGIGVAAGSPLSDGGGGMIYVADFGKSAAAPASHSSTVARWRRSCSKAMRLSGSSGRRTVKRRSSRSRRGVRRKKSASRRWRCSLPSPTTLTTPAPLR